MQEVGWLLFGIGCDWDATAHLEGHFVGRGIYFVARRDFEEGVSRFFSFDIGQSGDVFHLFPRIRKNFEDRCGEIVGGPHVSVILKGFPFHSPSLSVPRLVRRTPRAEIPPISR